MRLSLFCATALAATLAAEAAAAETAPAPAQAGTLDEVVVTARKREERLQDVPIAVTAIAGERLAQRNVVKFADLQQVAAGLTVQASAFGGNVPSFTIRAQRQFSPYMTLDASTAIYFADVVQSRPQGVNAALYDLESVQVLKGPQGTLYGRNTTGGAVLITPKAPTSQLGGYFHGVYGNYAQRTLEGALNLPLNDMLQLRVGGQMTRHDGYTKNVFNGLRLDDEHNESWRASLRFTPTADIENRLVVNGFHARENGLGYKLTALASPTPPGITYPAGLVASLAFIKTLPFHATDSDLPNPGARINTFGASNTTEWDLGFAKLKNVFGYRRVKSFVAFDLDGSPVNYFPSLENVRSKLLTDELQLSGTALQSNLDWIVGAYVFKETGFEQQTSVFLGLRDSQGYHDNRSYSGFAQATYHIPQVEGLSATAGVRVTRDERMFSAESKTNGVCRFPVSPCAVRRNVTYTQPTYTVGVDWKARPGLLVYATHSKGYHAGAFNFLANLVAQLDNPASPEIVKNYEVGLKSDWRLAGGPARLNIAAYHQDYSDVQRVVGSVVNGRFFSSLINAAAAKIDGVEVEAEWSPIESLRLSAHYAYTDPRYTTFRRATSATTSIDISPTKFIASKHTGGGEVRYQLPTPDSAGRVYASASAYYQSSTTFNEQNYDGTKFFPTSFIKPYTLVNARLEWQDVMGSNVSLAAYGRNLANKNYIAGGTDLVDSAGTTAAFMGAPRTYGVELNYRF